MVKKNQWLCKECYRVNSTQYDFCYQCRQPRSIIERKNDTPLVGQTSAGLTQGGRCGDPPFPKESPRDEKAHFNLVSCEFVEKWADKYLDYHLSHSNKSERILFLVDMLRELGHKIEGEKWTK